MYTVFKCIYESPGNAIFGVIQQWTITLKFCVPFVPYIDTCLQHSRT